MCFTAPTALSGAFSQRRRRLGENKNCGYVSTFAPRIAENLTHFSTIADLLATFVAYRTPTKKFLRAACASNFENGSFHPQKSAFSNHRDIWRRHISPRFEACRKRQRALQTYRLPLRIAPPDRSRCRCARQRKSFRPISAPLAAPPHSANADAVTIAAVARVFFEEMSNVIKTIYPFILSLNCNIKYHYSAMPKRQRPLVQTSPSRRRIATACRVLSPRSSYDRSLSASAYRNGVSRLIAMVVI